MFEIGVFAGFIQAGDVGQMPFEFIYFLLGEWVGRLPEFPLKSEEQRVDTLVEKDSIVYRQVDHFASILLKLLENVQHRLYFLLDNVDCLGIAASAKEVPRNQANMKI
jgi:hypothetical protein